LTCVLIHVSSKFEHTAANVCAATPRKNRSKLPSGANTSLSFGALLRVLCNLEMCVYSILSLQNYGLHGLYGPITDTRLGGHDISRASRSLVSFCPHLLRSRCRSIGISMHRWHRLIMCVMTCVCMHAEGPNSAGSTTQSNTTCSTPVQSAVEMLDVRARLFTFDVEFHFASLPCCVLLLLLLIHALPWRSA